MLIRSTYQTNVNNPNNASEIKFIEPGRKLRMLTAIFNLGTVIFPALQIQLCEICPVFIIIFLRKLLQASESSTDDLLSSRLLFTSLIQDFINPQ